MGNNKSYNNITKFAALCSVMGAITTMLLIFLPNPVAVDFEAQAALHDNALYMTKMWILFVHPQVNLIASLGLAVILIRKHPLKTVLGTLFLCVWAYTEISQQALIIDALNGFWRPGFLGSEDDSRRVLYRTLIEGAGALSDSKYFLVIYGFGLGSLFFGLAIKNTEKLGKWIGYSLIFIGFLSLSSFARYYLGLGFLTPAVDFCYTWIYPYLQPSVRIAIAIWLFKQLDTKDKLL
ncbi:MAG: hypothetical protein O2963_00825 [Proteobacteria bacterium]|nr:hypothetical protein [Pseudomonadota bacterium]